MFQTMIDFLVGSLLNTAWSFLPSGSREKYESKKRDKRMEKDLQKVRKLKAMIRNRRNLEQLQKQRRQKTGNRGESTKQETDPEGGIEIVPSAPPQDDIVVLEVIPEEATTTEMNEEANTVSFKKNQA